MPVTKYGLIRNAERVEASFSCNSLTFESPAVSYLLHRLSLPRYGLGTCSVDCTESCTHSSFCAEYPENNLQGVIISQCCPPPPVCRQVTTTADGKEIVTAGRLRADIVDAVNTAGGRASSHELEVCVSAVGRVGTRSSCV